MDPIIVDCDLLEAAKENVQPLAAGRRVTALSDILSTPHAQRDAKLAATRSRLRRNVEISLEDQDDNTLEAYCSLVYWTLEYYPQGNSAESGLIELLEEATRVLKDDQEGRWKSELKYLKLWTLYASYVERPTIIYRFILANDIGAEHALLYEEYATVLERNNLRSKADETYRLGIARQAQPLDRLQKRYNEFQKRMMVSSPTLAPSPQLASRPSTSSNHEPMARRAPLASTVTPSTGNPSSTSTLPSAPSAASRLQIFVDPEGSAGTGNAYPELGSRKTRVKENTKETGKLGGTTIKQAGKSKRIASSSSASSSKMAIYCDPTPPASSSTSAVDSPKPTTSPPTTFTPFVDTPKSPQGAKFVPFRDESAESPTTNSMFSEAVMKAKATIAISSQAEVLRKDPLKNYGDLDPLLLCEV
jgi:hypothetical protein